MTDHRVPAVIRASALLAVAGGALRVADSFTTDVLPAGAAALLYLLTDVLLLAAVAGIWWWRRAGRAVAASVVIFVLGILVIRVSAVAGFGAAGYQAGAVVALLGLAGYSVEALSRRSVAPWAPLLWLASLACAVVGALGVAPLALTTAAGVAYGAGFVAAGVEMGRQARSASTAGLTTLTGRPPA